MPAPTALKQQQLLLPDEDQQMPAPAGADDADFTLEGMNTLPTDSNTLTGTSAASSAPAPTAAAAGGDDDQDMDMDEESAPRFAPATAAEMAAGSAVHIQTRKVPVPPHRMTPLKSAWPKMYPPLVEHLRLQVRMNVKHKRVELRTSRHSGDGAGAGGPDESSAGGALQKGEDFVRAFCLGFDVDDAIALLRLDDLYIETFEVKDVKSLSGDHLARAIGRIAGKDGKTKFSIENASRTRVVLADSKIHILGGFKNIHIARESIVSLILGKPPGKVYNNLRTVSARMKERF